MDGTSQNSMSNIFLLSFMQGYLELLVFYARISRSSRYPWFYAREKFLGVKISSFFVLTSFHHDKPAAAVYRY